MKMKLLDYTIMSLMAGSAAGVWAAETKAEVQATSAASKTEATTAGVDCAAGQCDADGKMLFQLRSQSYDQPVT